jgi:hypothetical protein
MQITLTVTPDSDRTRRSLRARMRGSLRVWNFLGGALSVAGLGALLLGVPIGGGVLLTPGVVLLVGPWLLTRAAANARTGVFAEIATYELTDDAIRVRTRSLRAGYAWASVERVEDNGEFWIVVTGGNGVLVVPWTLLPPAEADTAREFLIDRRLLVAV